MIVRDFLPSLRKLNSQAKPISAWVLLVASAHCTSGCKNVVKADSQVNSAARHPLDYSFVKFAAYQGDAVLSAGDYTGLTTRAEVIDRAAQDIKASENCKAGSASAFCTKGDTEGIQWIQLFLPDGSSCSVGPAPEDTGIPACFDKS